MTAAQVNSYPRSPVDSMGHILNWLFSRISLLMDSGFRSQREKCHSNEVSRQTLTYTKEKIFPKVINQNMIPACITTSKCSVVP